MNIANRSRPRRPRIAAQCEALERRRLLSAALLDTPVAFNATGDRVDDAVATNGKIVFAPTWEGFFETPPLAYDIATGSVTAAPQADDLYAVSQAAAGTKVIFAGGFPEGTSGSPASDQVEVYDSVSGQWSSTHLATPRGLIKTVAVNGKAIFAGGFTEAGPGGVEGASSDVDIFDAATNQWSTSTLPEDVGFDWQAVSLSTLALFVGSDDAQIYDTASDQWSTHALSQSRGGGESLSVGPDLLVVGGEHADHLGAEHPSDVVDLYDSQTGQWTAATLPTPSDTVTSTVVGHVAVLSLGNSQVATFDADTGQWTSHQLPGSNAGTNFIADGNLVLFFGSHSVDIYHADTGAWSHTASALPTDFDSLSVKALIGAQVALFASSGRQIDLYDPTANAWSAVASGTGSEVSAAVSDGGDLYALGATQLQYGTAGPVAMDILSASNLPAPAPRGPKASVANASSYVFHWTSTPGATAYDLYLDHRRIATNIDATRFALPNGLAGGQHTWQAVAITPQGRLSSDAATFTAQVPRVVVTYESDSFPSTLSEQAQGTVKVKITNTGDAALLSPFRVAVLASSNGLLRSGYLINGGNSIASQPLQPGDSLELTLPATFDFKNDPGGAPVTLLVAVDSPTGGRHGSHRHLFAVKRGPSLPIKTSDS